MELLILGAGFSGKAIGARAAQNRVLIRGTTRSREKFSGLRDHSIEPIEFDGENLTDDLRDALKTTTHLIVSIAPSRNEADNKSDLPVDPSLRAFGTDHLKQIAPNLQWIGYLSTVGVYGNHDGAWVDETTRTKPSSERSRQRVRAESEWLEMGQAASIPTGIFRLSGIYGPSRNAFVTIKKGKSRRLNKKNQVFNRIHVADIAEALWLAASQRSDGIFNITDDEPAPPQDVVTFAHELMDKKPPPEMDFETADLSPMARSFYGENKRVSNAKSKEVLGLTYDWPNYRAAFTRMWREDSWL